jgi:RNA polymerase sigma factor (sigma-70 family)
MVQAVDDELLIGRTGEGDLDAFEELYARYSRRLFGFALRLTRNPDLVEEVVNDTLLALWRSAARFDGRSKGSTWIFGIAYRKALRALSRRRVTTPLDEVGYDRTEDPGEWPDAAYERREAATTLEVALRELPQEQRAVVELTFFQGLSYPEIARIVDCPVNTVKTRMFHARRKLRAALPRLGLSGTLGG